MSGYLMALTAVFFLEHQHHHRQLFRHNAGTV